MFYCDACREKNNWPMSFMVSLGSCEMCKKRAVCNDVPSHNLPSIKKEEDDNNES